MSIQIQPVELGYPLQTATTLTIIVGNFELSTATTTTYVNTYVAASGGTVIGTSTLQLPSAVFTAFTNNIGNSGLTTVEDYVLTSYEFTRQ